MLGQIGLSGIGFGLSHHYANGDSLTSNAVSLRQKGAFQGRDNHLPGYQAGLLVGVAFRGINNTGLVDSLINASATLPSINR